MKNSIRIYQFFYILFRNCFKKYLKTCEIERGVNNMK